MNQLVALLVGCILFFWGITYFMNTSLAGINQIQKNQYVFSTQATKNCDRYLFGAEEYLLAWTGQIPREGNCFTVDIGGIKQTRRTKLISRRDQVSKLLLK